jgi:iron complex outermembrane receptor protein
VPGLEELSLTAAVRIDDYDDVGSTTNPKIGVNWAPTEWLKLRGSYGTSFRAPGLVDNDPNSQRGYLIPTFPGSVIDPGLCPTCASSPTEIAIYQALGGAAGNLKPETSESWSVGFDIAPPASGARLSVTYWNVKYDGQVGTPAYNVGAFQAINQGYYDAAIIYNPSYFPQKAAGNPVAFFGPYPFNPANADCSAVDGQAITTQPLFDQLMACINANAEGPLLGAPSNNVAAIVNGHRMNAGSTHADGFDIAASYDWSSGMGDWHLGVTASYVNSWDVSVIPGAPVTDQVNMFGYPLRLRGRLDGSWTGEVGPGALTLAGYLNYANDYEIDQVLLPIGVSSSYTDIDSYTTVDLAVHYDFGEDAGSILDGLGLTVSAQNVFDADPPFVVNTSSTASIKFDPSNASPLGRVLQFEVSKKF